MEQLTLDQTLMQLEQASILLAEGLREDHEAIDELADICQSISLVRELLNTKIMPLSRTVAVMNDCGSRLNRLAIEL